MMRSICNPQRGSLILVVLCLLAVLGIGLAAFLAVGRQSVTLSNRSQQTVISAQLAEMGLEEAMRAFNTNNWSSWGPVNGATATWSTSGNTASCTIVLPSSKFGSSGITARVKVRVDNYNAYFLPSTWVGGTSYRYNDLVGYNGTWYRCVTAHSTTQTPYTLMATGYVNLRYWVPAPAPSAWASNITYKSEDVAYYSTNSRWYRYVNGSPSSGNLPTDSSYWTYIPFLTTFASFGSGNNEIISYPLATTWYRWDTATSGWQNAEIAWRWRASYPYSFNDLVYVYSAATTSYTWWRCKTAHTSGASFVSTNWEDALAASWDWSASDSYKLNDVVYRNGSFYRCIRAHTNQTPPNATYWSTAPLLPNTWDSGRQYSANSTVIHNGIWYRCITANNASNPATSSNWSSTANSLWSSSSTYNTSSYVSYGGVWYDCILAPTANQSPNNATYWTAMGAPVIYSEGSVTLPDGSATISTQLRATVTSASLFPNAIAATQTLVINGAGVIDSYDGSGGYTYNQTTAPFSAGSPNVGYSAVVAATGTTHPAVTVTGSTIKGYVAAPSSSSPYSPMWTYGGSAVLTGSGAAGVDLTRVSRSPYIPQFDTQSVIQHTTIPTSLPTTLNLGTPGAATPSIYTYAASLTLGTTNINITGPVILDIQGDLTIDNTGVIMIAATGSAEIHVSGRLLISGSSGINNSSTKDPKKLILICTGNSGSNQYTATPSFNFYGTIYMPNNSASNTLTIGPGHIYGAISAKNISFSGDANLHYDTSLRYATFGGVDSPYVISQWRELTDPAERAVLP